MTAKVDKIDKNKLVNFPSNLKNSKAKLDELDVDKLNTVAPNLKSCSE